MRRIVVLGAGYGGVMTAKKLAKRLKKDRDIRITLIDKNPYHTLLTELHEVAAGRVDETSVRVDLQKVFAGFKNVEVVLDEITDIDFRSRTLHSDRRQYNYDYLVIGTGSKPCFFGIPGAEEHAFTLWSHEDAVRLRDHIEAMFRKAACEKDPERRRDLLSFVVVGAGFTGVEMVGELAEQANVLARKTGVDRSDVRLYLVDMVQRILPMLPESLSRKAVRRLEKMGVQLMTGNPITEVMAGGVRVGENEVRAGTVIWTAGVEGSDLVGRLDLQQKGRKRIVANDMLQAVDDDRVYVIGDNLFFIPEGSEQPVPQMVENAEHSAELVAHNIVSDLKNGKKKPYRPKFHGTMVSIGSRYGVAYVGSPKRKFSLSGRMAMLVKHLINMLYLAQVCGFHKVWSYLSHEFFQIKDRRSIAGGHLAHRSPNFWLVPLRLFVGYVWFTEGLDKWKKIMEDPNRIFLIPAKAEGTSAATAAADGAGEAAMEALPVPDWIADRVQGMMDAMFYTQDGGFTALAGVFQTSMVVAELLFGALLFIGLFTALSSVCTILMGLMIWSSGMAAPEVLWLLMGGIALVGGSGSTFGLDYYVLPWLKERWKRLPFVKRWYLYT